MMPKSSLLAVLASVTLLLTAPSGTPAQQANEPSGQQSAPAQEQNQAPPTPPQLGGTKSAEPGKSSSPQGNADAPEDDPNLYLTTEQKAKIKAIRDDAELQIQAAEKDTTLTPEQRDRRIKGIRKATRAQVFAVLTPDQQKTWSAEQREKREAKKQPPKPQ